MKRKVTKLGEKTNSITIRKKPLLRPNDDFENIPVKTCSNTNENEMVITYTNDTDTKERHVIEIDSCDPRGFGPCVWKTLHIFAHNYPEVASEKHRKYCRQFLWSLSHMLPCKSCGKHFRNYLKSANWKRATRTQKDLEKMLVECHNEIKRKTTQEDNDFVPFTIEDSRSTYNKIKRSADLPIIWHMNL